MKLRTTSVPIYVFITANLFLHGIGQARLEDPVLVWSSSTNMHTDPVAFPFRDQTVTPAHSCGHIFPAPAVQHSTAVVGRATGPSSTRHRAAGGPDRVILGLRCCREVSRRGHQCKTGSRFAISKYGRCGSYFGLPSPGDWAGLFSIYLKQPTNKQHIGRGSWPLGAATHLQIPECFK